MSPLWILLLQPPPEDAAEWWEDEVERTLAYFGSNFEALAIGQAIVAEDERRYFANLDPDAGMRPRRDEADDISLPF